ncbi:arginine deiminase-related protein [Aquiflexum sp. LQ15W]|uniref:citrulline utilization hydrolase CtlX n=1 Tax=Cognataquiflexum nitidum TaxID=2922272 RepID=UPI001F137D56|nr:arginine deiminase-related protein [Cognataquiflexum nitidum]MCH6200844.1 arginine deiminase-related protein [Cognataquiflexum nitidum]
MTNQTTSHILMVRPANFGFNPETAENNFYQKKDDRDSIEINRIAQSEFDGFVSLLQEKGVDVLVVEDTALPKKTDAVFPNNWFSSHQDGKLILYPLFSPNRRLERRKDIVETLIQRGFRISEIVDLTFFEQDNQFLEGTGSLILDRINKVAYACRSQRTHQIPLGYFGKLMGYKIVDFDASQIINAVVSPIYHTNVMMHVGTEIAVVCLDSIPLASEKLKVQDYLERTGKKMIPITARQKFQFAGNMLEIQNKKGEKFTVMSDSAFQSLGEVQINTIKRYTEIVVPKIPTIEKIGGGSVRCMIAEIFLPSV